MDQNLPNLRGKCTPTTGKGFTNKTSFLSDKGVFDTIETLTKSGYETASSTAQMYYLSFNASDYNNTYSDNDNSVKPKSIACRFIIKY